MLVLSQSPRAGNTLEVSAVLDFSVENLPDRAAANSTSPDLYYSTPAGLLRHNESMTGIQFLTDEKGRKVSVVIDLKKHGAALEDFWDGLISESRRKEKGVPFETIKAELVRRGRLRA